MIQAIVRLQSCTTKPGRRAFVCKQWPRHGIAAGPIRYYEVTAPTWAAIRRAVADYDTVGRTMGFSGVRPDTVESWKETGAERTYSTVKPLPVGFRLEGGAL